MSDARRELLHGLIDLAGLFPPAALDVPGAVAQYRTAREHPHGWLVDRFVAPATKVEPVGNAAGALADDGGSRPWPLALVTDAAALRSAGEAAGRVAAVLRVDVVELRPLAADGLAGAIEAARIVFPGADVHAEVLPDDEAALDAIASVGGRVKLRCGGDRTPGADEVAAMLRGCTERGLTLKGTAGLHHPVAARETDGALRHGFLNLLAAAALGGDPDAVADTDPGSFVLDAGGFSWRGQAIDAAAARARFCGFGSCSFDEPVEDLVALGVLDAVAVAGR